ncbi:hypothetical protein Tco_0618882 [Tanacetum coccineum]
MTSFDYRLNRLKTIKECSLCGALYTSDYCCSKEGIVDKIIRELPSPSCARCGTPVDGPQCRGCALLRKKFKEDLFTYCVENGIFQDLQDTSESSDDNTNVVNAPQEPFVVKQDPDNPQSPPHIDHCCYECGDSFDDIFCQRCTCKFCGKGAHIGYNCPTQILIITNPKKKEEEKRIAEEQASKDRYWKIPICYDDDEDDTIAITPVLPIEEPDNSLKPCLVLIPSESEGIPNKMCDVPFCDHPTPLEAFKEHSEIVIDSNDDSTSSDDDSPYSEDIDYVDVSPPNSELVNLEVVEIVVPEVRGIDTDILLTIKDDIEKLLNVNLLIAKIKALKDNPTPSSNFVTKSSSTSLNFFLEETNTFDNSLPKYETFCFNLEEISSGSTTTHSDFSLSKYDSFIFDLSIDPFPPADRSDFYHEEFADELAHIISPPEYDCFYFKNEPELGDFTMDVVDDIFDNPTREPRVHVPNVFDYPDSGNSTIDVVEDIPVDVPNILPTHPALQLDFNFIPSLNDLGSDLDVSSPSGDSNKIYDPGICIEVEATRFLSTLSPVIDTLLPFSSENKDKVFNHSVLASKEKSSSLSIQGLKVSKLFHQKSPMLIHGDNTPNLGVRHPHFYPP